VSEAWVLWYYINMEKDTLPTTTFVSPQTGVEYLIVPETDRRAYFENGQRFWSDSTVYRIVLNGNPVQFALSEAGVADSVEHFENPGFDLGSRLD